MGRTIREIFRIDSIGNPWFVRILFAFLAILKCGVEVLPICDTNFDEFFSWFNAVLNHPEVVTSIDIHTIPLTQGNIIYVVLSLFADFMLVVGGYIYMGVLIRKVRVKNNLPGAITRGKFFARLLVLCCLTIILSLPLSFVLLYLSLIFIIIFPCMIMLPACYLSGDSSLFRSFSECIKKTKGYYLVNARTISIIVLINFVAEILMFALVDKAPMLVMVLSAFISIYSCLVLFRYVGIAYLRMVAVPGNRILIRMQPMPISEPETYSDDVREVEDEDDQEDK